jgi:hypothetical protein
MKVGIIVLFPVLEENLSSSHPASACTR